MNISETYFQSAIKKFDQVYKSAGDAVDFCFNIANQIVRIKFTTRRMAAVLTPALGHLLVNNSAGEQLTICCCDSVTSGVDFPDPPWSAKDYTQRGDIQGVNEGRLKTAFHTWSGVLSMFDTKEKVALYWVHNCNNLPSYEKSAPFLFIFNMGLSNGQKQLIHAAAVGYANGGVLLVGRGHSGKSMTALSCLDSELDYAGDDYCLLGNGNVPYVFSLYSSAKLLPEDMDKFAALKPALDTVNISQTDRAVYFLTRTHPHKIINGFPLKFILIARVGRNSQTLVSPARPGEALKALAHSTMVQLPTAGQQALQTIADIIKKVPCFSIELGTEISHIPSTIEALLRKYNLHLLDQ